MFLWHKKNKEAVLIVDVGSDSVGACISLFSAGEVPKILYSSRSNITWHQAPEKSRFVIGITKALNQVIKDIASQGLRVKIHRTQIIFSAPCYVCETRIFKTEHKDSFLVTQDFIDKVFGDAIEAFVTETKEKAHGMINHDLQIVEKRVIQTRINGYESSNPFNKKAHRFELALFISFVSKDILNAVQKAIDTHFHITKTEVSSFPVVAFNVFSAKMPKLQDFVVVDVRGEVTDVTLVCGGAIVSNVYFPQSKNSLVRTISDGLQDSFQDAFSSLKIALRGHGTAKLHDKVNKLTEIFKSVWSDAYVKAVREMLAGGSAPKTVFIVGDIGLEIYFENIFKGMKNVTSVHSLKNIDFKKYLDVSMSLEDPFLALETIFVNQL